MPGIIILATESAGRLVGCGRLGGTNARISEEGGNGAGTLGVRPDNIDTGTLDGTLDDTHTGTVGTGPDDTVTGSLLEATSMVGTDITSHLGVLLGIGCDNGPDNEGCTSSDGTDVGSVESTRDW